MHYSILLDRQRLLYNTLRGLRSIYSLLIFPMVFTLQRRSCPLTVVVSGLTMKDWSFAAGMCSVVGNGMSCLVVALVHSAVGGSMGSVVAVPVHSVGESMGSLVVEVVRFSEFSADSKLRQCTRRSNQLSQTLSQQLWQWYQNESRNVHVNIGIYLDNRFLRFRNHRQRCKKSRCSWSYFCIYRYNNSLRQSNLRLTNSTDRHNLGQKNGTTACNSFLVFVRLTNNRNLTCKAYRCNLIRTYIYHHNKLAILGSRNQTYTDNMLLERTDSYSKFLSFRSHNHKYTHWRLLQVARA